MKPWLAKLYGFHLLKIGNLSAEINTESLRHLAPGECLAGGKSNAGPG